MLAAIALAGFLATPWHHPLSYANGGFWGSRTCVTIRNNGDRPLVGAPVGIRIGANANELRLAGSDVRPLRVCRADGVELLFDLTARTGGSLRSGALSAGDTLTIPVDCPANATAAYYVYSGNPLALLPPDWLEATGDLRNGSVEQGSGDTPHGWMHDSGDSAHEASWTDERARSGRRALKLWVADGAEPTWISTRQSGIRLVAGARYRMTAWVRAENVRGTAGWYIHIGSATNTMMESPILPAGEGTFDWKTVALEFTAPAEADRADLGTVLRGSGTAWFDDVELEKLDGRQTSEVRVGEQETLRLAMRGQTTLWWSDPSRPRGPSPGRRTPIRIMNTTSEPLRGIVTVPVAGVLRQFQGRVAENRTTFVYEGKRVRAVRLGSDYMLDVEVPTRCIATAYAYIPDGSQVPSPRPAMATNAPVEYAPNPAVPGGMNRASASVDLGDYAALLGSTRNLARNASFEAGAELPDVWIGGAEGERPRDAAMGMTADGLFGRRAVRLSIPHSSTTAWTGWRQDVPVEPGRSYLFAAWLRCSDLRGSAQLHAHLRTASGELSHQGGMVSAGPTVSGSTGWTLVSGVFRTPEDCRIFQMHLTMLATGTLYHDGVVLIQVHPAEALAMEMRLVRAAQGMQVWPVIPLIKVFRDDSPPPRAPQAATILCARNEAEPLQLAVRSRRSLQGVRVVVAPPTSRQGRQLRDVRVGVIDYVPVDTVTNYYSDLMPAHYRKVPVGPPGSDGWPGLWPDPILPSTRFDLKANATQPVWITVRVPEATPAGTYGGTVRLLPAHGAQPLAVVPFTVRVLNFALPRTPSLKAIYDCRQSGPMWRVPGKTEQEARESFWQFMAEHRVCPDTIRPEPQISYRDGSVVADFTEFDRAAEVYFGKLGFPHAYTPWHFYLFGWGHLPGDKFGEQPYVGTAPYEGVDRSKLRPEFVRAYQACLRAYWSHVKEKGWADRITLYISDEPYDSDPAIRVQMKALCDMIHEVDPAIPIYCSTWHHQPEWDGKLDVWGIGHYGVVSTDVMRRLRDAGNRIWWTTDGQMCLDTPYCAIERLLPHYCVKYGAEAYEFWGIDWLTYDPYRYGWHAFLPHDFGPGQPRSYVRYPNGDGFLAYPPGPKKMREAVTSIRLEQAREGLEDYEYLVLLRRLAASEADARLLARAQRALTLADRLVVTPCEIGRYSTKILPNPDEVLRVRALVGDAIDRMSARRSGSRL